MHSPPALEFVSLDAAGVQGSTGFEDDSRFRMHWETFGAFGLDADRSERYSVRFGGREAVRLYLLRKTDFAKAWRDVPDLGNDPVRLHAIEVAADLRGRGLGTQTVRELETRYGASRLIALSLRESTGFWDTLGWHRCEHRTTWRRQRLYVSPDVADRTTLRSPDRRQA